MKKTANIAAYLFILSVVALSTISILGVWDFFAEDVIYKSFQSVGVLALVAVIVMVADHFIDQRAPAVAPEGIDGTSPVLSHGSEPLFKKIRIVTLFVLIVSASLLALFGVMAIWELFTDEVLHKSLTSIAIAAFSSLIIVATCLERENNPVLYKKHISGGTILIVLFLCWLFFGLLV
jgi:hypothetical protein